MNLAEFRDLYPEFEAADDSLVEAHLGQQTELTKGNIPDASKEQIIGLRTADALAHSPLARDLKLVNEDDESVYYKPLDKAIKAATIHKRS